MYNPKDWQNLVATIDFFKELKAEFWCCLNSGWYETSEPMVVQRLRGQRDVFEAITRILGEEREE